MQMDGDIYFCLQPFDEIVCLHGQEQIRHILDADVIGTHLYEFL